MDSQLDEKLAESEVARSVATLTLPEPHEPPEPQPLG